jgi:hypothetical protein
LIAPERAAAAAHPDHPRWAVSASGAAAIPITDWLAEVSPEPDEVRKLCRTPESLRYLREVVEVARGCFPPGSVVSLKAERDSESDARWVLADVAMKEGVADALPCYRRFTAEWVKKTPPAARDLIHLTFHFV